MGFWTNIFVIMIPPNMPLSEDCDAYYDLSEEIREAHLWWCDFEDAGTPVEEALWAVVEENGIDEPDVSGEDLARKMIENACKC